MSSKMKRYISDIAILFICICFTGMYIVLGNPSYDTNDDEVMNMIAVGAYGPDSQYLVYIKLVLGYFIKLLYALFPHINCYWWFFIILNLVAIYSLCWAITEKEDLHVKILVTTLVGFVLGQAFFEHIQYTQNASLYAVASYVLLYRALMEKDKGFSMRLLFSIGFAITSFLTRSVCFGLVSPFAGVMFIAMLWRSKEQVLNRENLKKIGIWCGFVVLLLGISILIEHYGYGTKEWQDYLKLKEIRHHFVDYDHMYEEDAKALGYSESTITMLKGFNYADTNVFSFDNLSELLKSYKEKTPLPLGPTWIMMTCRTVLEYIIGGNVLAIIWIILLAFSVNRRNKYDVFITCGMSLGILVGYWFLLAFLKLEWRAEIGMWLATVFLGMIYMKDTITGTGENGCEKSSPKGLLSAYVCIVFICFSAILDISYSHKISEMGEDGKSSRIEFFHTIKGGNCLYICPIDTDCCEYDVLTINDGYSGLMENALYMGGWLSSSPLSLYYTSEWGITNPITALWESENVRLAADDDEAEMVLTFISENYGDQNIDMEYEGEVVGYKTWRFYKTEEF